MHTQGGVVATFIVTNLNDSGAGSLRAATGGSALGNDRDDRRLPKFIVANSEEADLASRVLSLRGRE